MRFALQALPRLHMLLHARTTTPEGRAGALRLIAALIRLESTGAQDGASSERPRRRTERPPRAVLSDLRDNAPVGPSGAVGPCGAVVSVAEAVVRGGVVLSCLFHLLGHSTLLVDYLPESPDRPSPIAPIAPTAPTDPIAPTDPPTDPPPDPLPDPPPDPLLQGASIEVRAAAVDTLCALLADATVGPAAEELLDRCLAPQVGATDRH